MPMSVFSTAASDIERLIVSPYPASFMAIMTYGIARYCDIPIYKIAFGCSSVGMGCGLIGGIVIFGFMYGMQIKQNGWEWPEISTCVFPLIPIGLSILHVGIYWIGLYTINSLTNFGKFLM